FNLYNSKYQYYDDGRVKFIEDERTYESNELPPQEDYHLFDRGYSYDHLGRLVTGLSGDEARGGNIADGPYKETYQYDIWNNMTDRIDRIWSKSPGGFNQPYVNNRIQLFGYQYDEDGNLLSNEGGTPNKYDASGRKSSFPTYRRYVVTPCGPVCQPTWNSIVAHATYDGDGQLVKQVEVPNQNRHFDTFSIRSTVLGGEVISLIEQSVDTGQTFSEPPLISIYAGGVKIANSTNGTINFEHWEPLTGRRSGVGPAGGFSVEPDPLGQEVGICDPGPDEPVDVGYYPEPHELGTSKIQVQ